MMLLLLTLATILALSVRCSFGYPKRLKKATAQGQSPIQSQSASPDRDEFRGRYIKTSRNFYSGTMYVMYLAFTGTPIMRLSQKPRYNAAPRDWKTSSL